MRAGSWSADFPTFSMLRPLVGAERSSRWHMPGDVQSTGATASARACGPAAGVGFPDEPGRAQRRAPAGSGPRARRMALLSPSVHSTVTKRRSARRGKRASRRSHSRTWRRGLGRSSTPRFSECTSPRTRVVASLSRAQTELTLGAPHARDSLRPRQQRSARRA